MVLYLTLTATVILTSSLLAHSFAEIMLSSTHVRLTRTSSDLRLLATMLCPPSPILTPNDLLSPSTSGEIPLIIDFVIDKYSTPLNSPLIFGYDTDICTPPKPSRFEIDVAAAQIRLSKLPRSQMTASSLAALSSNLASPHGASESLLDEVFFTPRSSQSSQSLVSTPSPSPSPLSKSLFQLTHIRSLAVSDSVGSSLSETPNARTVLGGANRQAWVFNSRMASNLAMAVPVADKENEQIVYLGTSATFSTLPTPSFAPPSPSPSVDVISPISFTYSRRHRRPLERSGAIHHLKTPRSIPRTSRLQLHAHEPQSPVIAPVRTTRWQLTDSPSASSIHSCPSTSTTSGDPGISKHPYLPRDLAWLGGTEVELWIDQEGFRAIRPMMRLVGYSPRSRSLLPYGERGVSSDVRGGVAEFMPVKRESFAFHYATLDGPPMLRRVTVGGDESRDYLSRHAALNIKTNGVYTVLGSESMALGSSQEHVKTQWKFDYLVDDRYTDGSRRVLPGEKIITPLTFSCSPFLLHPMQGKKVGFVHLVKKSVVPKLSAEKLEPPERPKNVGQLNQIQRMASRRRMRRHGPSRSDAHANPEGILTLASGALVGRSPLGPSKGGRILEGTRQMQYTRRRRASSAGEHGYVISSLHELMSAPPVTIAEHATAELPKMSALRNEDPHRARLITTLRSTHHHGYLKGCQYDKRPAR